MTRKIEHNQETEKNPKKPNQNVPKTKKKKSRTRDATGPAHLQQLAMEGLSVRSITDATSVK
jgi:hypothetical protein